MSALRPIPCWGMTDQEITNPTSAADPVAPTLRDDAAVREALAVIDDALTQMFHRELVSSGEVADLLLDVRTLLATNQA